MTIRVPPLTPGPDDGGRENLTRLADRIEKHVRHYRWLTYVNVVMFGGNMAFMLVVFVAQWWLRH